MIQQPNLPSGQTTEANYQIQQDVGKNEGQAIGTMAGGVAIGQLAVYLSHTAPTETTVARTDKTKLGPNPYKGLLAFQTTDGDRFFGRERQVAILWERLHSFYESDEMRLLPIYGPSGSGKSSLARAGLIPELGRRPLPGYDRARVAVLVPGTHPLEALAAILARMATNDPAPIAKTREFVEELKRKNETGDRDGLRRIADFLPDIASSPLIVLVDQFEEIYTLCESEEERDAFVGNLLVAASDRAKHVTAIATLRSDFLGETQKHPVLNRLLSDRGYLVSAMDAAELRDAIRKPAENAGYPLDEATIDLLVAETEGRQGALPLLQFALARIWDGVVAGKEPAETLNEIGGVGGALAGEAQRIYDGLNEEERVTARRVFLGLVQLGEGVRDTRRRVAIESLISYREKPEQVKQTIAHFAEPGVRLITLSARGRTETAEVTHEALFSYWKALRDWLDASRNDLRFQRDLEDAAQDWEDGGRPEGRLWRSPDLDLLRDFVRRSGDDMTPLQMDFYRASEKGERDRRWWRRAIAGVLAVGAVGITVLAGWAGLQWQKAVRREVNAEIMALSLKTEAIRRNGLRIEALIEGLDTWQRADAAAKKGQIDPAAKMRAVLALQKVTQGMRARNRLEGHSVGVWHATFSPDGNTLASASEDKTARLWHKDGTPLATLEGHSAEVSYVTFAPDGNTLASASFDKTVRLWRKDGTLLTTLEGHSAPVRHVTFSPDGNTLASASFDKTVRLWRKDGTPLATLEGHSAPVRHVTFGPDGNTIASASFDKTVRLWQKDGTPLATLEGHSEPVRHVTFGPDGNTIASASFDKTVRLWQKDGTPLATLEGHSEPVWYVTFGPDGNTLASASFDKTVRLWRKDGTSLATLEGHSAPVRHATFSPDGNTIASASDDNTARLWRKDGTPLATLEGHAFWVLHVMFAPDGNTLASASLDGTVRLWRKDGIPLIPLEGHSAGVSHVTFASDGNTLVSASLDNTVRLWQKDGTPLAALQGHSDWVSHVTLAPDGNAIASSSRDNTARLWQKDGTPLATLEGHSAPVWHVTFAPDGNTLASASEDKTVRLWQRDGTPLATLEGHSSLVGYVTFAPDGNILASASLDKTVRLWQKDGTPLAILEGHSAGVRHATFSPDGNTIASASLDNTVRLWQKDGTPLATLEGHSARVWHATFSPDGDTLASASDDNTVRLWQKDGTPLATLEGHSAGVRRVAFAPDGNTLASASLDGTARLWRKDGTLLATLEGHAAGVLHATFSPDGNTLASASLDGTVRLWLFDLLALQNLGCDWLHDYLVQHPDDLATLELCQTPQRLQVAASAALRKGEELAKAGNFEKAVALFELAKGWNSQYSFDPQVKAAPAWIWQGRDRATKGQIDEAVAAYQKAQKFDRTLDLDPDTEAADDSPEAVAKAIATRTQLEKGREFARGGKVKEAIAAFQKALEFDPSIDLNSDTPASDRNPQVVAEAIAAPIRAEERLKAGRWLAFEGKVDEAIAAFQQAIALDPSIADLDPETAESEKDPEATARAIAARKPRNEGMALARTGKAADAIALFQQALSIDPSIDLNPDTAAIENDPKAAAAALSRSK